MPLLSLTVEEGRILKAMLSERARGGSNPAPRKRGNRPNSYLVKIGSPAQRPNDGNQGGFGGGGYEGTIYPVPGSVYKIEEDVLTDQEITVQCVNVTDSDMPAGYYLASRDPFSGLYVLAGGGGGEEYQGPEYYGGTASADIEAGSVGTVSVQFVGGGYEDHECLNITNVMCPEGRGCSVRKDPNGAWSLIWHNVCEQLEDEVS